MAMIKKIFFAIFCTLVIGCISDDGDSSSSQIGIVTGLTIRDGIGYAYAKYGNPNVYTDKEINVYPTIVTDVINVGCSSDIKSIWIVPAEPSKSFGTVDFETILNEETYSESEIIEISKKTTEIEVPEVEGDVHEVAEEEEGQLTISSISLESLYSNVYLLNLVELSDGFYRIFVKTSNGIFFDNFYVDSENNFSNENDFDFFKEVF